MKLIAEDAGGRSHLIEDDYIEGTPELVVEVSSAANNLYDKKKVYRRTRVQEYVIWQTFENKLD